MDLSGIAGEALERLAVPCLALETVDDRRRSQDLRVAWANPRARSRFGESIVGAHMDRDEPLGVLAGFASEVMVARSRQRVATIERSVRRLGRIERLRCTIIPTDRGAAVLVEDADPEPSAIDSVGPSLAQVERWGNLGVWEVDLASGEVYWSTQVFEILGVEESGLESFRACVHPDDRELLDHVIGRILDQPGPYRLTHRIVRDGTVRTVDQHMQSVAGPGGTPARLLGTMIDATDTQAMENRMLQAETARTVGLMAGGLVHDFKNSLTVIAGHAQLLLSDPRLDGGMQASLEAIERAAETASATSRKLMTLGRHDGHVLPTEVSGLIADVVSFVGPAVSPEVDLRIDLGSAHRDRAVLTDPAQFNQALIDLVLNAREAGATTVTIRFDTRSVAPTTASADAGGVVAGTYGVVSVEDDGQGMDVGTLEKAFEPFFSTKTGDQGSGLGLANVRALADRCQGAVTIDSTIGVGTTVHLHLPVADEPHPRRPSRRGRATRILVVSTRTVRAAHLASVLRAGGHQTVSAAAGTAVRFTLDTEPIDLVVTDDSLDERARQLLPADLPTVLVSPESLGTEHHTHHVVDDEALRTLVDELLS